MLSRQHIAARKRDAMLCVVGKLRIENNITSKLYLYINTIPTRRYEKQAVRCSVLTCRAFVWWVFSDRWIISNSFFKLATLSRSPTKSSVNAGREGSTRHLKMSSVYVHICHVCEFYLSRVRRVGVGRLAGWRSLSYIDEDAVRQNWPRLWVQLCGHEIHSGVYRAPRFRLEFEIGDDRESVVVMVGADENQRWWRLGFGTASLMNESGCVVGRHSGRLVTSMFTTHLLSSSTARRRATPHRRPSAKHMRMCICFQFDQRLRMWMGLIRCV